MKWASEQFQPNILSSRTKVVTDHADLKWLTTILPKKSDLQLKDPRFQLLRNFMIQPEQTLCVCSTKAD